MSARSERAAGTFVFIEDLGSANGTRVREAWDEVGRPLGKGALVPLVHGVAGVFLALACAALASRNLR